MAKRKTKRQVKAKVIDDIGHRVVNAGDVSGLGSIGVSFLNTNSYVLPANVQASLTKTQLKRLSQPYRRNSTAAKEARKLLGIK